MKKAIILTGLSVILLATMVLPVMGQWDIGIQVGDWFTYETELIQWETDGVPFPPWWNPGLGAINDTDYVTYTVTAIDENFINFTEYRMWNNGSDITTTLDYNITGGPEYLVIGANMTEGEQVRPESQYFGPMILNASQMRTFNNSVTREVNVLNYTGFGIDTQYLWDAETGVQVQYFTGGMEVSDFNTGSTVAYWARMELVDSSIEELEIVPDLTGVILLLTTMSITIPIALLRRRKNLID
jgi:hypothetical protein